MKLFARGFGRHRYDPDEAQAVIDRLAADLDTSEGKREQAEERIRELEAIVVSEHARADDAEQAFARLLETVERAADAEVEAITVPQIGHRDITPGDEPTQPVPLWKAPFAIGEVVKVDPDALDPARITWGTTPPAEPEPGHQPDGELDATQQLEVAEAPA